MAKGDQATAQQATTQLGGQANKGTTNLQNNLTDQLNTMVGQFQTPYTNAVNQQQSGYNEIMNNFRNFLSQGSPYNNPNRGPYNTSTQPYNGPSGNNSNVLYPGGRNKPLNQGLAGTNNEGNDQIIQSGQFPTMTGGGYTGLGPGGMSRLGPEGQIISGDMAQLQQNPTQGATSGGNAAPSQGTGNPNADFMKFMQDKGYTGTFARTNMPQIVKEFNQQYGYNAQPGTPNASGTTDTLRLGSDQPWIDVIHGGDDKLQWSPETTMTGGQNAINSALGGYGNFAQTGGFSPQDIENLRARAAAPIRGVYSQAQDELDRSRALNNGVSPNYAAASAKMAREQSNNIANQLSNTDAGIAQLRQQGQLAGLGGLSQTGLGSQQVGLGAQQLGLMGRGQDLSALQGMSGLYGTSPGAAGTFGNQYLQAALGGAGQQINLQQLLNSLNLGLIGANQTNATIPSTFQNVLGNIGKIEGLIPGLAFA